MSKVAGPQKYRHFYSEEKVVEANGFPSFYLLKLKFYNLMIQVLKMEEGGAGLLYLHSTSYRHLDT